VKGAGLRAPDPVHVTTGPLFGIIAQGLGEFEPLKSKIAEVFEKDNLWHHPKFSTAADTAYNLEFFMFPREKLRAARLEDNRLMLKSTLPFKSRFKFDFDMRVLELPHQPVFLGLILSRIQPDGRISSGYKIGGPGCGGPGEPKRSIMAYYPRPDLLDQFNPVSLDYKPSEFDR
jgi:hypothetical protein